MGAWLARWIIAALSAGVLAASAACGSPASPSADSPRRVAGAWLANSTLADVSGGECVGLTLQSTAGIRDVFTAALRQDGAALEATVASQGNGTSCAYSGSVSGSSVMLRLTSCQSGRIAGVECRDGARRDLALASGTVTANINADVGTGSGREESAWSVFVSGTSAPVGTLTLAADFNWIFLGLPSSDYHVFTGTIFPGYEDGTISIPADPNPFCVTCGWFAGPR